RRHPADRRTAEGLGMRLSFGLRSPSGRGWGWGSTAEGRASAQASSTPTQPSPSRGRAFAAILGIALLSACATSSQPGGTAASDPLATPASGEWPSDGRDYTAQRYSPLTQIDASNVNQLGLAWYDDLDTFRGVEATPLYADGVLYNILPFNV